jgi:hypothetical protein
MVDVDLSSLDRISTSRDFRNNIRQMHLPPFSPHFFAKFTSRHFCHQRCISSKAKKKTEVKRPPARPNDGGCRLHAPST